MSKFNWKKLLPHLAAIAVFYLVTVVYFAPIFFENKDLSQGDVTSYLGWGDDARQHFEKTGEYCYWSNAMFGGMPSNYAYPAPSNNIFKYLQGLFTGFLPLNTAGAFFAYLIGFYLFLLAMGSNVLLSVLGALAYAFCSYNVIIIEAGHVSKALVMATMAPVVGGIVLCYRRKYIAGVLMTLIATGMNVFWNHQQISFYLILTILCLAVVYFIYAIREHALKDFFKSSAVLVVVALLAAAPAVDKLLPMLDFSKETMRGGAVLNSDADDGKETSGLDIDYAYQWSYGKMETMTLLIPDFYGASSHYDIGNDSRTFETLKPTGQASQFCRYAPMYWGDQPFTSGPVYAGAVICFLFVLGLLICKGPERWWMLAATLVAFVLSWGRNFPAVNEWLFYHLPLYNKFRTPSMALVIVNLTMAAMAVFSLKKVIDTENKKSLLQPLYIALGITGGLCLVFAIFGSSMFDFRGAQDARFPDWLQAALVADRQAMFTSDALRSLIFIVAAVSALLVYIKYGFNTVLVVGLLAVLDLWTVDKRFVNSDSFIPKKKSRGIEATAIDKSIMEDNVAGARVLNLSSNTFNESRTSYFHKSVGGYSPVKLRRYQDIIDYYFSESITPNVLDMLNTGYIIYNTEQGQRIQKRQSAMGHAWFVNGVEWVESPDQEIERLATVNLATTAIVDKEWHDKIKGNSVVENGSTAIIELTDYKSPGNLLYTSRSEEPRLAVFSEVYYKTWRAYVDDEEVPVVRANYILRAVEVPAGYHTIEFKCVDELYETTHTWSLVISIIIGVLIVLLLVIGLYNTLKHNIIVK